MEVTALVIAILSFFVATLALGWQVAAWRLEGPRLRATLQHGLFGAGGAVVAAVGHDGKLRDMSSMRHQGWNGPEVIAIEVTNHGRSRAKITRYSIRLKRGGMTVEYPRGNSWSPPLPHWLEPGESATWYAELRDAAALVSATRTVHSYAGGALMSVETGTGKVVRTRRHLEL